MRLNVLLGMTPATVRRAADRLRLVGHKRVESGALIRYTAAVKGSGDPRTVVIDIDDSEDVKVRCTCKYFQETLLPSLLRAGALLVPSDVRTARGLARTTKRLGVCKHLFMVGILIHKKKLDPDEDDSEDKKKDTPGKKAKVTISSKLRSV